MEASQEVLKMDQRAHSSSKMIYLPGLNGLRAIVALVVVIAHTTSSLSKFGLNSRLLGVDKAGNAIGFSLAGYGVTIFFTLSGFLITFLLLKEKSTTGSVNIKHFYARRALRIWPLYYLYLGISLATLWAYSLPFAYESIPYYVFLAANVPFILGWELSFLGHYWSLGVEEQFYLFFPLLARTSKSTFRNWVVGILLVILFVKFVFWFLYRTKGIEWPYVAITVTRYQTLLIGAIGAMVYASGNRSFLRLITHKGTQLAAWLVVLLLAVNRFHIATVIDSELVAVVAVLLIVGQIEGRNRIVNLETTICNFIGKISYGIYVIHPLVIFYLSRLTGPLEDAFWNYVLVYSGVLVSTVLLAFLSYELYEKRFLRLKERYTAVKSTNSPTERIQQESFR
jgi:peptidoglycan/LPS O-acetylase OafA/YrhL